MIIIHGGEYMPAAVIPCKRDYLIYPLRGYNNDNPREPKVNETRNRILQLRERYFGDNKDVTMFGIPYDIRKTIFLVCDVIGHEHYYPLLIYYVLVGRPHIWQMVTPQAHLLFNLITGGKNVI